MTAKARGPKKSKRPNDSGQNREDKKEHHAPAGRGGTAMGRTVGLPFGGGAARKRRKAKSTESGKERR